VFGIVGAIVGAAIAGVCGFFVARHSARAATKEAQRKESLEIKAAAQLVGASFMDGRAMIDTMNLRGQWVYSVVSLSLEPWQTYRHVLTRAVSEEDFLVVYQAANSLRVLIDLQSKAEKAGRRDIDIKEGGNEAFIIGMGDKMADAFRILVRLSKSLETAIPPKPLQNEVEADS
jgi:hypothetical protein